MGRPDKCGSSHWKCSVKKKAVFKNSANFTGKHLLEFAFRKVRPATLLKLDSNTSFPVKFVTFLKTRILKISHTKTVYTFCILKLYKIYTTDVYKMYATFQQTFADILYTKSKELCQLNFVYKMWTKVCRNVGYILYTNILYTICIHQFWSTKSVHHKHYVYNLYTKFMQHVYTNNCIKNRSLISTFFTHLLCTFKLIIANN